MPVIVFEWFCPYCGTPMSMGFDGLQEDYDFCSRCGTKYTIQLYVDRSEVKK